MSIALWEGLLCIYIYFFCLTVIFFCHVCFSSRLTILFSVSVSVCYKPNNELHACADARFMTVVEDAAGKYSVERLRNSDGYSPPVRPLMPNAACSASAVRVSNRTLQVCGRCGLTCNRDRVGSCNIRVRNVDAPLLVRAVRYCSFVSLFILFF